MHDKSFLGKLGKIVGKIASVAKPVISVVGQLTKDYSPNPAEAREKLLAALEPVVREELSKDFSDEPAEQNFLSTLIPAVLPIVIDQLTKDYASEANLTVVSEDPIGEEKFLTALLPILPAVIGAMAKNASFSE